MGEANICMYCGREGDASREHVIAEWVGWEIFGERFADRLSTFTHKASDTIVDATGVRNVPRAITTKQGNLGTRVVRSVCRPCNMGWMGKIQEAAKPIITPLLHGDWVELNAQQAEILASWACMTTINVDSSDPNGGGIRAEERAHFFRYGAPSDNWGIWISPKTGGDDLGVYHRPFGLRIVSPPYPSDQGGKIGMNSQITTLELGRLLVHAVNFPGLSDNWDPMIYTPEVAMAPIFPTWMCEAFEWNDIQILPQSQVLTVMDSLYADLMSLGHNNKELMTFITGANN